MEIAIRLSDDDVQRIAAAVVALMPAAPAPTVSAPTRLHSEIEAARSLGISASTLKRMRLAGEVRPSVARKPIRYSREDIDTAARVMSKRK